MKRRCKNLARATALALVITTHSTGVFAQTQLSCEQLWQARNTIFARNGYCFQTARGRATFGAGCFAPYGELGPADRAEVQSLQYWERAKGCPP